MEEDIGLFHYQSARKVGKPMGPFEPHYPNKAERTLLTRMMQKSGQTEEQVRSEKSNRRKLAAAQKSMSQGKGKMHRFNILLKRAKRNIAAKFGLPVYHPVVEKALDQKEFGRGGLTIREALWQQI